MANDSDTLKHIEAAAKWVESCKSTLLLVGSVGNGKTTLARAVYYVLLDAIERQRGYCATTECRAMTARQLAEYAGTDEWDNIASSRVLLIDDVGTDSPEVLKYGQPYTPFEDMIYARYDNNLPTIISSNLTGAELKARYGERVMDRLTDMASVIKFTNRSYRGK